MDNKEKVLDKLRKIWELYEGAKQIGSEEEANTAAALLQRHLMKANITMDELRSTMTEQQKADDEVIEETMSWYTKKSIGGYWEFNLLNVIAKHNLCRVFYLGPKKLRKMIILGKRCNVEWCQYLHGMLKERYVQWSREKYDQYMSTTAWLLDPIVLDTYQRRYLLGCCDGLDIKFQEMDIANRVEDSSYDKACTALVLRNDGALDTYIGDKWER